MLINSILSLYIASTISPNISQAYKFKSNQTTPQAIVKTASSLSNILNSAPIPIKKSAYIKPIIEARSSIAIDEKSGAVLFEKNAHQRIPIASITKMMTILIILEENSLSDVVQVGITSANTEGSTMYLRKDESITVKDLVYGAIIASANDAATALAEFNSGTTTKFVEKMNKKAKLLGLTNTHFGNPVGLDGSQNYSSAFDVAKLGKQLYQNPLIKEIALIKNTEVQSVDGKYTHKLESTNELLDSYLNIKGLKTGFTQLAGECLVSIAEGENGNEILTVVLNSPRRFTETKILTDWIFRAYNW